MSDSPRISTLSETTPFGQQPVSERTLAVVNVQRFGTKVSSSVTYKGNLQTPLTCTVHPVCCGNLKRPTVTFRFFFPGGSRDLFLWREGSIGARVSRTKFPYPRRTTRGHTAERREREKATSKGRGGVGAGVFVKARMGLLR